MKTKRRRTPPEVIVRDGEPRAVIVDIDEYQEMLERLDDADDLRMLEEMRKRPLKFRRLEEFLEECEPGLCGLGEVGAATRRACVVKEGGFHC